MTENTGFQSKRSRTVLGLVVVAISIVLAVVLAGVSFAQNSSTSAAQYQYGKITICHYTHSKKKPGHTITISQNAWKAHKKHGDTLGACPATVPPKAKDNGKGKDEGKGKGKDDDGNKSGTTPGTTAPTTGAGSTGDQGKGNAGDNGNGNGNNGNSGDKGKSGDHGNAGGNGNGKGKGK